MSVVSHASKYRDVSPASLTHVQCGSGVGLLSQGVRKVDMKQAKSRTSGKSPVFKNRGEQRRVCCQKDNAAELVIKRQIAIEAL